MPSPPHKDLADRFVSLLVEDLKEQVYQKFLEQNPQFIPQEFVQNHGIHLSLVFRKLKLAENYITDFFYLSKSSADWNAVFVELEKPSTCYFKAASDEFSTEFLNGLAQINRWRAWVQTEGNLSHMLRETLEPVWTPHSMRSNPVHSKFVLVTGRRSEFENDDRRRALVHAQERDDFKIISYDSSVDGFSSNQPVYLVMRSNSHIDILSDLFVSEATLAWIEPSRLRISQTLKDHAYASRDMWRHGLNHKTLERALPKIAIRTDTEAET